MPTRTDLLLAVSAGLFLLPGLQGWIESVRARLDNLPISGWVLPQHDRAHSTEPSGPAQIVPPAPDETPTGMPSATVYGELVVVPSHPYEAFLYDVYTPTLQTTFKKLAWEAYEQASPKLIRKRLTGVVLENAYLKLIVLPELGGRIYSCVFKPTGHNEFYRNPVLKPTHWGPAEQGWWLAAGGMEWCFPVEEHGYETAVPWQFSTLQTAEGITVTVWNAPSAAQLRVKIDVHLPKDRAYFAITPHLENPTARSMDYKFWINAMLAPGGTNAPSNRLRFIFPTDRMTIHSLDKRWSGLPGPGEGVTWPTLGGRDLSVLGNWPYYLGCFERPAAQNDFMGVYDAAVEEGIVRVFPSAIARGAKAFAFGYGDGALQPELWTDGRSSYVEIHGGVAPTFADYATLAAGDELTWTEFWYPVTDIGGFVSANQDAALNLETSADGVHVGVATTFPYQDAVLSVRHRADNTRLLYEVIPSLDPARPHRAGPIPTSGTAVTNLAVTLTTSEGQPILSY